MESIIKLLTIIQYSINETLDIVITILKTPNLPL